MVERTFDFSRAPIPKRVPTANLDEAKSETEKRQDAFHKKQRALAKAEADLAALPSQLQSAKADVKRTSKQISDLTKRAEQILGKITDGDVAVRLKRVAVELHAAESDCTSKEEESRKNAEGKADANEVFTRLERVRAVLAENIQSLTQQIEDAVAETAELRVIYTRSTPIMTITDPELNLKGVLPPTHGTTSPTDISPSP